MISLCMDRPPCPWATCHTRAPCPGHFQVRLVRHSALISVWKDCVCVSVSTFLMLRPFFCRHVPWEVCDRLVEHYGWKQRAAVRSRSRNGGFFKQLIQHKGHLLSSCKQNKASPLTYTYTYIYYTCTSPILFALVLCIG